MTLTSSGPVCDVCGRYILLEPVHEFTANVTTAALHSHGDCKRLVEAASDWRELPEGPLKRAYQEANKGAKE
jgi:hypothetical protein